MRLKYPSNKASAPCHKGNSAIHPLAWPGTKPNRATVSSQTARQPGGQAARRHQNQFVKKEKKSHRSPDGGRHLLTQSGPTQVPSFLNFKYCKYGVLYLKYLFVTYLKHGRASLPDFQHFRIFAFPHFLVSAFSHFPIFRFPQFPTLSIPTVPPSIIKPMTH